MKRVLFIVGPTGIGKTEISLTLAEQMDAEIVSADSRQVYRFMDIGTAKPTKEQLARVPHHFIDIKYPDESYSAGQYGSEARHCIAEIFQRGKQPMVVGGSGLYLQALAEGFFGPRISDERVKADLKNRLQNQGLATLYAELSEVDPVTAARLHATDTQRILRALEVYQITGQPFSGHLKKKPAPPGFAPCWVGLTRDRPTLYARIEARVDAMVDAGLIDEARELLRKGYRPQLNALQSVGYQEAILFLQNKLTYPEMVRLIKQKTRNYAKRQITWFKKDERVKWLDCGSYENRAELAARIRHTFAQTATSITKLA